SIAGTGPALVVAADGADDLHNVAEMRRLYAAGNKLVCATRYATGGDQTGGPRLQRWLSQWVSRFLQKHQAIPVSDATNSFRLYDAAIVNEVGIESRHGSTVALELTAKFAARCDSMAEVPTTRKVDEGAPTRLGLWKRIKYSWEWFAYALRHRRQDQRPLAKTHSTRHSSHV
ncbi:MAG: hypothetical protein KDA86_28320, partial [Planctomycetaceae bacterium]|nr:hypothetical protein [Planctomycetaceae bacterium]